MSDLKILGLLVVGFVLGGVASCDSGSYGIKHQQDLMGWTIRAGHWAQLNSWSDTESTIRLANIEGETVRVVTIDAPDVCVYDTHDHLAIRLSVNGDEFGSTADCEGHKLQMIVSNRDSDRFDKALVLKAKDGEATAQAPAYTKQVVFPTAGYKEVIDLVK